MLNDIPEEHVIDRFSLEQRIEELEEGLASLPKRELTQEHLSLTFRGEPVLGSEAISADFAGKATSSFSDAFSAILAGINENLRYSGPIPDKARYPLLITGTAIGSFGFEMEVPLDEEDLFSEHIKSSGAVELLKNLLRVSAKGSDDEISDIVEEIHPRAVKKVADFLGVLSQSGAWCGLEFRGDFFRYKNIEEVRLSETRLKKENIRETVEYYTGEFQGILPVGRHFEFAVQGEDYVLKGRLGPDIDDPDHLNREWLHLPVKVKLNVIQVGQGRPRFTLSSLDDLERI
ncbi:hypothetical protein [Sagittula sp. MA-2]|uniref:hypothetical protein n=1 Tax=Sagittula sp. MA-2 TaxID=3048007 RepID=UPI0024C39D37|nr:hypothetical protein [Sagittula sp. MA-2]WHZ35477.1 hypothetical protein QNI11_00380 [Sagittula sp. MA-2]